MTEKTYLIRRLPDESGRMALCGAFDPAKLVDPYLPLNEALINHFPWPSNDYRPDSRARVGWNAGGLHVLMYAREREIRSAVTQTGGPVCTDSCLEFFLAPDVTQALYLNCEVSPRPTVHLGIGAGRANRTVLQTLPDGMEPVASRHEGGWWAVSYTIPARFLRESFHVTLSSGLKMRGNFYKCGDQTALPHYGMYHPYNLPQPDFHRPERFADFALE